MMRREIPAHHGGAAQPTLRWSVLELRVLLLMLASVRVTASLSAQVAGESAQTRRIAGCYTTQMGSWSGPLPPTGMPVAHTPPAQFQLDTAVVRVGSQALAVHPARLAGQRPWAVATWVLRGPDSIIVVWTTGFVGVTLQLAVRQDSLIGHATTFHDAHIIGEPPDPSAPIIAARRACPP
jgi:hypothetical protein